MNRTQHTISNSLWGTAARIVSVFVPFVIRTIIINTLGADYLGLNSLFTSILQILNMAELGLSSAIVFSLYKPLAEKQTDIVCALMQLYRKLYRFIGWGILGIGVLLTPLLTLLVKGELPSDINIYVLYWMYLFNTSVSYLLYAYKTAILTADQRSDIISGTNMCILLVQYVLQIVVLLLFKNYYLYYILTPIFTCAYNLCIAYIVDKEYPQYKPHGTLATEIVSVLKQKIKGVIISKICMITRNAISSIVLSATMGLVSVAIFSNYFLIVTSIASFMTVVTTAMSASVGNSMVMESEEKNYSDFKKFTFIYAIISIFCTVCLFALYQPFMELWMGKDLMFPMYMVVAFSIYYLILSSGDIRATYMNAKGLWWENRYRTILESVSNVVLSLVLVIAIGPVGAILGPLLSLLLFNFGMSTFILYKYCFPSYSVKEYFKMYGGYFSVTVVLCVITETVLLLLENPVTMFGLLWQAFLCISITCFGLWGVLRYSRSYADAVAFVKNVLDSKRK